MDESNSLDSLMTINPAVRLLPRSELNPEGWIAENLLDRRRFVVPMAAVVMLLHSFVPTDAAALVERTSRRLKVSTNEAGKTLKNLRELNLLVDDGLAKRDKQLLQFKATQRTWRSRNWVEAAEYNAVTFNYPGLDYARDGRLVETRRMREYVFSEEDSNRTKVYEDCLQITLPPPSAELLQAPIAKALRTPEESTITAEGLKQALSMTFGALYQARPRRWRGAPLLRRTSPSGGARHPTEAYLVNLEVPGLPAGLSHIAVAPVRLEILRDRPLTKAELDQLFPRAYGAAPFAAKGIVVLTCVFERNMFRYREPRTFRSVHMDAGHLVDTLQIACNALSMRSFVSYSDNDYGIEAILGVDGLVEGHMVAVALG